MQGRAGMETTEEPDGGKGDDQVAKASGPEEEDPIHRGGKGRLLLTAEKGKMMFIR